MVAKKIFLTFSFLLCIKEETIDKRMVHHDSAGITVSYGALYAVLNPLADGDAMLIDNRYANDWNFAFEYDLSVDDVVYIYISVSEVIPDDDPYFYFRIELT